MWPRSSGRSDPTARWVSRKHSALLPNCNYYRHDGVLYIERFFLRAFWKSLNHSGHRHLLPRLHKPRWHLLTFFYYFFSSLLEPRQKPRAEEPARGTRSPLSPRPSCTVPGLAAPLPPAVRTCAPFPELRTHSRCSAGPFPAAPRSCRGEVSREGAGLNLTREPAGGSGPGRCTAGQRQEVATKLPRGWRACSFLLSRCTGWDNWDSGSVFLLLNFLLTFTVRSETAHSNASSQQKGAPPGYP